MCSHYQAVKDRDRFFRKFGAFPPDPSGVFDVWPTYRTAFIRRPREADAGDDAVPEQEARVGMFGLLPHWAKDDKFGRRTFNARSETAAKLPSFRDAWRQGHRCIIPADAFYEPDWRSGKAIPTRIERADGEPLGIAGLWSWWRPPGGGEDVLSFSMLTINAADHALMCNFHKPTDEKRMVVVLPESAYGDWLSAPVERTNEFLLPYPASKLVATGSLDVKKDIGGS